MKKIVLFLAVLGFMSVATAQTTENDKVKKQLQTEASQIAQNLKLNQTTEKLVYNVLYHIKTRIDDLAFGTENYDRLLDYIDEERSEMMKIILQPNNKYSEYNKLYSPAAIVKVKELKAQNAQYIKDQKDKAIHDQQESEEIMQKEKAMSE